jgi:hypothetical protein
VELEQADTATPHRWGIRLSGGYRPVGVLVGSRFAFSK